MKMVYNRYYNSKPIYRWAGKPTCHALTTTEITRCRYLPSPRSMVASPSPVVRQRTKSEDQNTLDGGRHIRGRSDARTPALEPTIPRLTKVLL